MKTDVSSQSMFLVSAFWCWLPADNTTPKTPVFRADMVITPVFLFLR